MAARFPDVSATQGISVAINMTASSLGVSAINGGS